MMQNRKILILLVVLCTITTISAQNTVVDSLSQLLKDSKDTDVQARLYGDIAVEFYNRQVYHDSAYYYNERAYELSQKHGYVNQEARALYNFGMIHTALGDYDIAIDYYEKSKNLFTQKPTLSVVNSSIGALHYEKKSYELAASSFHEAIDISLKLKDTLGAAIDYVNLGEVEYLMGDFEKSKETLTKALNWMDVSGVTFAGTHIYYANVLLALDEIPEAEIEGKKGYRLAHEESDLKKISEAADLLYRICIKKDNPEMAIGYFEEYHNYKDSLNAAREQNNIEKLKLNFDLSRKEKELAYVSQKNKYMIIIYVLGALGVLLLIFLISRQRKVAKMTQEMHDVQTKLVSRELEEREQRKKNRIGATSNFELTKNQDQIIK